MKTSILLNKIIKGLAAVIFWIAVWYLAAIMIGKELFLPYPHKVLKRLFVLAAEKSFWETVGASLLRIVLGFCYGVLLGFCLGVVTYKISVAKTLLSPMIRVIRATPVVSFILLAFLWLDNDTIPVFIALLMVVPIVWQNVLAGLESRDMRLKEMARVFKLSPLKTFVKITFPELKPHFYSGCLTSLGLAWKSGIAAEVISYPKVAIGKEMNNAKVILETADVFVWTVTVVVLSLLLEAVFKLIFKGKKPPKKEAMKND